ncbi:MAG: hypothetical protein O3B37_13930 [Proteobacteria bacterium]|nr:hypothetical protein [Pseudomonadota bacterium]
MSDTIIEDLSPGELATVVELQRVELKRLLSEQKRLNDRIDLLLQLQEREQVLRQQMQASIERLLDQRSGAHATSTLPMSDEVPMLSDRLDRAERRFHALRTAVGHLVVALERQITGEGRATNRPT